MLPFPLMRRLCLLSALVFAAAAYADDQVTVYRCQTNSGKVTLGDAPCPAGQEQEVRQMQRPQDPPPAPAPVVTPTPPPAPIVRDVVVYRTPPRPMYECTVAEDGSTYTSDDPQGNPRLVPLWSLGYPNNGYLNGGRGQGAVVVGNTWIHDSCHQLPPAEVCDRLRDRRYQIQRQYHSALQSERHALDKEQRSLEARLDNDCGAR